MKICKRCRLFHREDSLLCTRCRGDLEEISFYDALQLTRKKSLKDKISGKKKKLPDAYKQHYIMGYLGDSSLFLLFDLYRNRLKHGRRLKRFFIQPVNFTAALNIPWFFFNVIASNIFHLHYTGYCPRCHCKVNPRLHDKEECAYNIEYFQILDDILSGEIVETKALYRKRAHESTPPDKKNPYSDLFLRNKKAEMILDFLSVGFSIFLWIFLAVYVSYPMFQVLMQKLEFYDAYEWIFL